jgi:hypothetical protein
MLASVRKSTGSEFVLLKVRTFKIVQKYGLWYLATTPCYILPLKDTRGHNVTGQMVSDTLWSGCQMILDSV